MATNEKLMTLLRLMDEPENVTEEQLRELLADEEVREAYELMADCKLLYQRDRRNKPTTLPVRFGQRWIFRIAAVFITAVFIGGLAWAISPLLSPKSEKKQSTEITAPPQQARAGGESITFTDIRLDSMLSIVGKHYGKRVVFKKRELRSLRIHTKWNKHEDLTAFINNLNELGVVKLTVEGDYILVNTLKRYTP